MMSSVTPSEKYSCSGSLLVFEQEEHAAGLAERMDEASTSLGFSEKRPTIFLRLADGTAFLCAHRSG